MRSLVQRQNIDISIYCVRMRRLVPRQNVDIPMYFTGCVILLLVDGYKPTNR